MRNGVSGPTPGGNLPELRGSVALGAEHPPSFSSELDGGKLAVALAHRIEDLFMEGNRIEENGELARGGGQPIILWIGAPFARDQFISTRRLARSLTLAAQAITPVRLAGGGVPGEQAAARRTADNLPPVGAERGCLN